MLINNYKNLIKLFLVLGFAYLISMFFIKNIFLANSPRIRPNLDGYFLAKINNAKENMLAKLNFDFIPSFQQQGPTNEVPANTVAENTDSEETFDLLKESLQPITKGVSAASRDGYSYTEFRLNKIEWAQITYTLRNGESIIIEYPKGTEPPPKEIYEGR